jgi:hypothetical protein
MVDSLQSDLVQWTHLQDDDTNIDRVNVDIAGDEDDDGDHDRDHSQR